MSGLKIIKSIYTRIEHLQSLFSLSDDEGDRSILQIQLNELDNLLSFIKDPIDFDYYLGEVK